MSDVEVSDSELQYKSGESSLTGEEEWISVTKNMELHPLKQSKKTPPQEKEPPDKREGSGDQSQLTLSEDTEETLEQTDRDISVEDTHTRALLRERFLKLISKLPGQKCTINFFEKTTQKCTIRACEPYFENIIVEDLTTCYATAIPRAIVRVGDIISMHIEVDDIAHFS